MLKLLDIQVNVGINSLADNMTNNTPYGVDVAVRLIIVMAVIEEG
jgi:hypothetical protein